MNQALYILRGSLPSAWDALFPASRPLYRTWENQEKEGSAPAFLHDIPHEASMRHEVFFPEMTR
jgi:hypothetical protein